jgi:hypothetical protein
MPISSVIALASCVAAFRTTKDPEDPRTTAFPLVIPEGVGPVNPVNPCSCSVIFSLGVLRLFLGAPG